MTRSHVTSCFDVFTLCFLLVSLHPLFLPFSTMGFCRRCGEIVPAQMSRCKCGGSAVAPAVNWNQSPQKDGSPDKWAKTYVSTTISRQTTSIGVSNSAPEQLYTLDAIGKRGVNQSPTKPARRFPRPLNTVGPSLSLTDGRVLHHIASTTTLQNLSPMKSNPVIPLRGSLGSTPTDVITSPDDATLAKAYGSILQRTDTLPIHTCAICSSIFPPDATIYPDPQTPSDIAPRFLCRSCFAAHGGSKGNCANCHREVLTVTREGGFIESTGMVWHKRCFRCESCHREIGHAPMVDLYGKPSCTECFDSCLDKKSTPKIRPPESPSNIGGMRYRSRESSPALEELSERLGIKRQATPEVQRDAPRETCISPSRMRTSSHPCDDDSLQLRAPLGGSPRPEILSYQETSVSPRKLPVPLRTVAIGSVTPVKPTTPSLSSSSSCSDSLSSCAPSTPSNSPRQSLTPTSVTPKAKGALKPLQAGAVEGKCSRCFQSLFSASGNGQIVTVPIDSGTGFTTSYHASCFRCFVCGDVFEDKHGGHARFVNDSRGVCHPECMKADRCESIRRHSPSRPISVFDCIPEHSPKSAPPLARPFPRFGGSELCPGCRKPVSLMEYGVVPGPQNSRWHGSCLVCGGKGAKHPRPGCGKKLDSAAKTDHNGNVWCRECMLLLPSGTCTSPQGSPIRAGLTPSYTGAGSDRLPRPEAGRLFGQVTGAGFEPRPGGLMRQYTGGAAGIMRRGSVSPTRQMTRSVSPTKGLMPVTRHPRPAGSWKHKSVDEGRGMFLVKQMTGTGQ
ncbi:hypothetical protein K439DRAFT_832127 [Ramaria rubella]|nr:hypothetical protein K439DRAFT_832127 [Ramaria rubella]